MMHVVDDQLGDDFPFKDGNDQFSITELLPHVFVLTSFRQHKVQEFFVFFIFLLTHLISLKFFAKSKLIKTRFIQCLHKVLCIKLVIIIQGKDATTFSFEWDQDALLE